jgi:hypothetical protein
MDIVQLQNLKAKSLLEDIGDGFRGVSAHDLYLQFAKLEGGKLVGVGEPRWGYIRATKSSQAHKPAGSGAFPDANPKFTEP